MKEWSHKKKFRKYEWSRMVHPTCPSKKYFSWSAKGWTWSSQPSSARISSVYLMYHFKMPGDETEILGANHPTQPHPTTQQNSTNLRSNNWKYLSHPLGLTFSTPSLGYFLYFFYISQFSKCIVPWSQILRAITNYFGTFNKKSMSGERACDP